MDIPSSFLSFSLQTNGSETSYRYQENAFENKRESLEWSFSKAFRCFGRGDKNRTRDTRFWRPLLYQLSYSPKVPKSSIQQNYCPCQYEKDTRL